MNFRRLIFAGLCCLAAACGKVEAGGQGFNGECVRNSDCASPFYCKDGHCVLDAATVCQAGKKRCNGDAVETCSDAGDRWEIASPADNCATTCKDAKCVDPVCTPNQKKCDGSMIFECLSNGSGWVFVQSCPTSCDATTQECSTPICSPFETKCKDGDTDHVTLETCNSRGTAWVDSSCGDKDQTLCYSGRCLPKVCSVSTDSTGAVTSREERCRGTVAEQCDDSQTTWQTKQVCSNGCDFDATNKKASCPAAACVPFETKCKDMGTLSTCNSRGTAFVDAACDPATQVCYSGQCVPKACSVQKSATTGAVTSREERCNGNVHEACNDTETGFSAVEVCQYGCTLNGNTPVCAPPKCADGEMTCDGLALEKCTPDHGSFGFVQYCPSGCSVDSTTTPATAGCNALACSPLARQCQTDSTTGQSYVQVCRADGTGFDKVEYCPQACSGGECQVTASTCNPGDIRCSGYEVEQCVRLSTGATEWRFSERCLGQCVNGTCSGGQGSAGCVGGASATAVCGGATGTPVVPLHAMLADPTNEKVPCDGLSRVLVYSDVIGGAAPMTLPDGTITHAVPVPDGTMVTFTNDFPSGAPDSLIASQDADPKTPGLQRPTLHGVAMVVIKAPATCAATGRAVTVTGSVGGRATGSTVVNFAVPPPPPSGATPTKTVYVAEDFTTTTYLDRANTTAVWDLTKGASVAIPAYDLGTGADGDLSFDTTSNATGLDLSAVGYARSWNVQSMSAQDVSVDNVLPSLAPGDEVLIYTLWQNGGAGTVGNYEFKRVLSVASGRIVFQDPIRNTYGNNGVFDTTQRTIVQRVPQFNNVTVGKGALLYSSGATAQAGYPIGGTGIVAFRARGTVRMLGHIDQNGRGLPSSLSNYPSATTSTALSRLLEGNTGGGIVFVTAGNLTFRDTNNAYASATDGFIRADSGGTVWVAGPNFDLSTNTTRFSSVGGHIRLDYGAVDNVPNTAGNAAIASGSYYIGQSGSFTTQSLAAYDEKAAAPSSAMNVYGAEVIGVVGAPTTVTTGSGSTKVTSIVATTTTITPFPANGLGSTALTQSLPEFTIYGSADDGTTWGKPAGAGTQPGLIAFAYNQAPTPSIGTRFRWKVTSATLDDKTVYLRSVAYKLSLH